MKFFARLIVFLLLGTVLPGQSVEEIVSRGLQALGGVQRLQAVKSRKIEGSVELGGGQMTADYTVHQGRPNLFRIDIQVPDNPFVQAFDGEQVWELRPVTFGGSGTPEEITGRAAESVVLSSTFESPLINYRKKGHTVELVGKYMVGDQETFRLKLTRKNGTVSYYHLDTETYLNRMTSRLSYFPQVGEVEVEQRVSDYRVVDGIMVAHHLESSANGQVFSEFRVSRVTLNVKLQPGQFHKPSTTE